MSRRALQCCALSVFLFVAAVQSLEAPLTEWTRVLLTDAAKDDGAVCIDGTPAAVYVKPGVGENAKRFILFWEGGCVIGHLLKPLQLQLAPHVLFSAAYSRPPPFVSLSAEAGASPLRVRRWIHVCLLAPEDCAVAHLPPHRIVVVGGSDCLGPCRMTSARAPLTLPLPPFACRLLRPLLHSAWQQLVVPADYNLVQVPRHPLPQLHDESNVLRVLVCVRPVL